MGDAADNGLRWYQGVSRDQWLALAAALLGWLFDGFEMGIFPLVARPALSSLLGVAAAGGGDEALIGLWNSRLTAAFLLGAACGGWLFGWLGDRLGRVPALTLSVLVYSLFTGSCGLAANVYQLAGLRFLAALGMGGEWSLGVALVMESWPGHARPMLAGLIGAAANVGFALTGGLVLAVEGAGLPVAGQGWRWVLGFCTFPALLTFFIRLFVPESERWRQAVHQAEGRRPALWAIFTRGLWPRTLLGMALAGVALIGTWASVQWLPLWVHQLTRAQQMANWVQLLSGAGAALGAFGGAWLGHYLARRWAYFLLCAGSLLVCAYLFRWHRHWFPQVDGWFAVTAFLVGAWTASFYGWLPLYLPELFPTRVRATGQGFSYNAGRIVAAGGTLSMGWLMSDAVFAGDYARASATVSLIYLVGLVLIWLAPETRRQPLPE